MKKRQRKLIAAFGSLCAVNFVCALDATSLGVALTVISIDLHGTAIEAYWSGASFLLTSTVFQPTFTSLSHIFGRRHLLLAALTLFTLGAGSGSILTLSYVITTDLVSLRERGKWFGLITMTWAVGTVLGPVVGGALAQPSSWRFIFWLNLPLCAVPYIAIPVCLTINKVSGTFWEKIKRMDWIGSFLFTASLTSCLISITWGGTMHPWNHWKVLTPLILGSFGMIVFMVWSHLFQEKAILRSSMFKSRNALATYLETVIHGMILWSLLYYTAAKGYSGLISGIAQFPFTFTVGPFAVVIGVIIAKKNSYRWAIWLGWLTALVGICHIPIFKADTPASIWIPISLLAGAGLGILYPAMSFAIQASATDTDLPYAASLFTFFRSFGQMLGVAIGGVIFQNALRSKLESYPSLAAEAQNITKDAAAMVEAIRRMQKSPLKDSLIESYIVALRMVWFGMSCLAVLASVVALVFTKDSTLNKALCSEQSIDKISAMDTEIDETPLGEKIG
ncbi:MFS general substrate transporter [Zopfia rhizophila CBS 207.26]|uniref:MFS general substrate transporter n=1 Tax=Zopfia rhizophila CBS 207.26 TaxID=1314779 RepID=A0A6A6ECE1_9PEZI|nr:MFS general substrate transporter [Zopfia rhizophila CBS 207.26]